MVESDYRRCWSCDAAHSATARFCSLCGARLSSTLKKHRHRRNVTAFCASIERRQLTVVFCDLVGSTKLSLVCDPEDYTRIICAYRDAAASVIRQWRGYIAKYVGDGLLAYFGYPRASEDDALRAVTSSWDLVRAVSSLQLGELGLAGDVAAHWPLQARVGIHTGLALVGEIIGRESSESDAALGAGPNIAAKLQTLANPGSVVISEATARLLPIGIEVCPLENDKVESNKTGLRAFTIKSFPQRFVSRRAISRECFIARRLQLSRVISSVAGGRDEAARYMLVGEPGIGKTRFVQEVIRHPVAASLPWIELACSPHGQRSTLHPFRPLLDAAGINPERSDLSSFKFRRRTFEQLKVAILQYGPRLGLLIEDMHWADRTTLAFIGELMSAANAKQIVWLMTSRLAPQRPIAQYNILCVETLDRLLPGEAAELARAASGDRQLTSFQLTEIIDRADGVPLYIEEFVRTVVEFGNAGTGRIPSTLRDSLMSRLDALGTARSVVLNASILGRHFSYHQLYELLELSEDELIAALNSLTGAGILLQVGLIPNASFEFRHALLRDIAYQTLLRSKRDRLHHRVVQLAAEGVFGEVDSMPGLLAIHHSLGGNPKEAVDNWLKAGCDAIKRSANAEALDHLSRGLKDCEQLAKIDSHAAARAELGLLSAFRRP